MKQNIPLFKIYWDEDDVTSVSDAIRAGMYWAIGPKIEEFEKLLAEYIETKYAIVFNSGTSALHACLAANGIGKGDEVIVPSFTFIATANSVKFVGATPVFADIEDETFGLDPSDVKKKITKKTKAIIPVHYGGCPCKIEELREIANEKDLILIEDAAEAFGATFNGKKVGSFGDSAVLSFCSNKIITTGEGGAVVTNDPVLYEKLKLLRSHGRLEKSNYFSTHSGIDYISLGYNFRMSNITAALGVSQIKKVEKIIEMRRQNAKYMIEKLSKNKNITVNKELKNTRHVYQMLTIRTKNRDKLIPHLTSKGIFSKVFFEPVHKTKFYSNEYSSVKLPSTENISNSVLTIPLYPSMTKDDMNTVLEAVNSW